MTGRDYSWRIGHIGVDGEPGNSIVGPVLSSLTVRLGEESVGLESEGVSWEGVGGLPIEGGISF